MEGVKLKYGNGIPRHPERLKEPIIKDLKIKCYCATSAVIIGHKLKSYRCQSFMSTVKLTNAHISYMSSSLTYSMHGWHEIQISVKITSRDEKQSCCHGKLWRGEGDRLACWPLTCFITLYNPADFFWLSIPQYGTILAWMFNTVASTSDPAASFAGRTLLVVSLVSGTDRPLLCFHGAHNKSNLLCFFSTAFICLRNKIRTFS